MGTTLAMIKAWRLVAHVEGRAETTRSLNANSIEDAHKAKSRAAAWVVIKHDLDRLAADYRVLEAL